jgi:hypothetical protein
MMCPSTAIQLLAGLVLLGMDPLAIPTRKPPAMPRQGVPRPAVPRLPLPIACPGPRGTSLRCNEPLSRSVPRPVRSGKARRAFVRNGTSPAPTGTPPGARAAPGRVSAHRRRHPVTRPAPPPSRCVASKASGREPLLPFPRPCVAKPADHVTGGNARIYLVIGRSTEFQSFRLVELRDSNP